MCDFSTQFTHCTQFTQWGDELRCDRVTSCIISIGFNTAINHSPRGFRCSGLFLFIFEPISKFKVKISISSRSCILWLSLFKFDKHEITIFPISSTSCFKNAFSNFNHYKNACFYLIYITYRCVLCSTSMR